MARSQMSTGLIRHLPGHVMHWNQVFSPAIYGFTSIGNEIDAITNGIACGFDAGDFLFLLDTSTSYVASQKVAATLIATLATPVGYGMQKHPFRVQVGATTAGGVPATTGIYSYTAQSPYAQGVFRFALADKDDCSQITLDQGIFCIDNAQSWSLSFAISYCNLAATDSVTANKTFFEIGVGDAAISLDPAVAFATNNVRFKIVGNSLIFASQAGTIGALQTPTTESVLSLEYCHTERQLTGFCNGQKMGTYTVAAAVTNYQIAARCCHLTAYTALADAPLTVDLDSILFNHLVPK